MAERIDIEREVEKIIESSVSREHYLFPQMTSGIIALCIRVRNEQREEDAKIAEGHEPWTFRRGGDKPHYTSCEGCGEKVAADIRATSIRNGEQPADMKGTKG